MSQNDDEAFYLTCLDDAESRSMCEKRCFTNGLRTLFGYWRSGDKRGLRRSLIPKARLLNRFFFFKRHRPFMHHTCHRFLHPIVLELRRGEADSTVGIIRRTNRNKSEKGPNDDGENRTGSNAHVDRVSSSFVEGFHCAGRVLWRRDTLFREQTSCIYPFDGGLMKDHVLTRRHFGVME